MWPLVHCLSDRSTGKMKKITLHHLNRNGIQMDVIIVTSRWGNIAVLGIGSDFDKDLLKETIYILKSGAA